MQFSTGPVGKTEWEAGPDDPQWFLQLQDSAPVCKNQMFLYKSQHLSKTSIFSMLIRKSMALRIPINQVWSSTWIFFQPGVCSHLLSLWGLLGVTFLNIQWPPSHQACAKTCWPYTLFPEDRRGFFLLISTIKPWVASASNSSSGEVGNFFPQYSNLKNVNRSNVERILWWILYACHFDSTTNTLLFLLDHKSTHQSIHLTLFYFFMCYMVYHRPPG